MLFSRSAAASGDGQASIRDCRRVVLLRRQASISCSPGEAPWDLVRGDGRGRRTSEGERGVTWIESAILGGLGGVESQYG